MLHITTFGMYLKKSTTILILCCKQLQECLTVFCRSMVLSHQLLVISLHDVDYSGCKIRQWYVSYILN
uniref:Uncharacterized protein n=1 Tax=Arundo donax TaxID=35708 RepID=A0A0A9DHC9_ARUDO